MHWRPILLKSKPAALYAQSVGEAQAFTRATDGKQQTLLETPDVFCIVEFSSTSRKIPLRLHSPDNPFAAPPTPDCPLLRHLFSAPENTICASRGHLMALLSRLMVLQKRHTLRPDSPFGAQESPYAAPEEQAAPPAGRSHQSDIGPV